MFPASAWLKNGEFQFKIFIDHRYTFALICIYCMFVYIQIKESIFKL